MTDPRTSAESPRYEDVRNAALPWGYWLLAEDRTGHQVVDEEGSRWDSIRDCLWRSRLGMPGLPRAAFDEALEFLLSMLAILDRRIIGLEERVHDLFDGAWHAADHYLHWLRGQRLYYQAPPNGSEGPLTAEGRAILVMLASTRSPKHAPLPIGLEWVRMRQGIDRGEGDARLSDLIAEHEAFAEKLPCRFLRRQLGQRHAIVLIGDNLGPGVAVRRTLWSLTFPDRFARDRFYLWLLSRIDRWSDWAQEADRGGARTLSDRLLTMAFCLLDGSSEGREESQ